jgi:hypothetical protein
MSMLGESFGDLFQRWRKLRLSVLAAFFGHSAGGEKFASTPQLFFTVGSWISNVSGIRDARFVAAAVLATPSRRPSLDYQSVIESGNSENAGRSRT